MAQTTAERYTTERCYDVTGGTLKLVLQTDHPLTQRELEALVRVAESYLGCFEKLRSEPRTDDEDEAIWELGGEENICAG